MDEKLLINDCNIAYMGPTTVLDCGLLNNVMSTEKALSIVSFSPLLVINLSLKWTK